MNIRGPRFTAAVGKERRIPFVFVKCNYCGATAEYEGWPDQWSSQRALADFRKKHECTVDFNSSPGYYMDRK